MWDEIKYPFPNFDGCTTDVCEWVFYFTPPLYWAYDYLSMLGLKLISNKSQYKNWPTVSWHQPSQESCSKPKWNNMASSGIYRSLVVTSLSGNNLHQGLLRRLLNKKFWTSHDDDFRVTLPSWVAVTHGVIMYKILHKQFSNQWLKAPWHSCDVIVMLRGRNGVTSRWMYMR